MDAGLRLRQSSDGFTQILNLSCIPREHLVLRIMYIMSNGTIVWWFNAAHCSSDDSPNAVPRQQVSIITVQSRWTPMICSVVLHQQMSLDADASDF